MLLLLLLLMVMLLLNDHKRRRRWGQMLFTARHCRMRRSIHYDGIGGDRMVQWGWLSAWRIAGIICTATGIGYD